MYEKCSLIPKGKVTTYKLIADALKSHPRAVGQALKVNPYAPKVPCHRIIASDGSLGGFMGQTAGKELEKKKRLLQSEGIVVEGNNISNIKQVLFYQ